MVRVERSIRIAAPASVVWDILSDFSLAEIAKGICSRVEATGNAVGAVRTMYISTAWNDGYTGGAEVCVKERLETLDPAGRSMTYRLIDPGPLPFADYLGSVRVSGDGDDSCVTVMTSAFRPVGIEPAEAETLSRNSIDRALGNLSEAASRRLSLAK